MILEADGWKHKIGRLHRYSGAKCQRHTTDVVQGLTKPRRRMREPRIANDENRGSHEDLGTTNHRTEKVKQTNTAGITSKRR
jgi:hypothetical protein